MAREKILTERGKKKLKNIAGAAALVTTIGGGFAAGHFNEDAHKQVKHAEELVEEAKTHTEQGEQVSPDQIQEISDEYNSAQNNRRRAQGALFLGAVGVMANAARTTQRQIERTKHEQN